MNLRERIDFMPLIRRLSGRIARLNLRSQSTDFRRPGNPAVRRTPASLSADGGHVVGQRGGGYAHDENRTVLRRDEGASDGAGGVVGNGIGPLVIQNDVGVVTD